MLKTRKLDDQSFEEIVEQAKGRLPWLCPAWTDHNAHDPGITILELMAWYKELQQYHMDQLTPDLQRKLLELAGIRLELERPAACALEIGPDDPAHLSLSRLTNEQEVVFELAEPIPASRPDLRDVQVRQNGKWKDVSPLLYGGPAFQPFSFGGRDESILALGFARLPEGTLRLWFDVASPIGPRRNPCDSESRPPRTLSWTMEGVGNVEPERDDTWALSWSGFVTLPVPKKWRKGEKGLYWLTIRQLEPGCEEKVRLLGLSDRRFRAVQQESRARQYRFLVKSAAGQQVVINTAQAMEAELAVFLRTDQGWTQTDQYRAWKSPQGRCLEVDAAGCAQDGEDNLLVVCLDPLRVRDLLFDAKGLPEETIDLNLGGQRALPEHMSLMCLTLERDGTVRPAIWHRVDDLISCGPRDRAFVYDPVRETITFGDGAHGSVVSPGEGAILITELILSRCGGGNVPENAALTFEDAIVPVRNLAAAGGRDRETLDQARGRLLRRLNHTVKCQSAEDFAQRAMETPGLRLAGAKALPGYDSGAGGARRSACVTVVVLPAAEDEPRPMPDQRFLEAVQRQLERYRPICVAVRVAPPRYVPLRATVELLVTAGTEKETVRQALEGWLSPRADRIGDPVRRDDGAALLQKLPGVLQIRQLELRGTDQSSRLTPGGDLSIPPDGLPALENVMIEFVQI